MENYTIESAKKFLKDNGYFVDNLWCVDDVKDKYVCTDEKAHEVLNSALTNSATMDQIWFAIDMDAEIEDLPKKSKYFSISGFWKDTKEKFSDMIVKDSEEGTEEEDEKIFYYGLTKYEIQGVIEKRWESNLDFVITSYKETTLN